MNVSEDRGAVTIKQNGFQYQTRLGITSKNIEKIYEQWSKELSKQEYGSVKLGECEKSTDEIECKSSRKGNICVNTNEDDIMSRKSYRPAEYAAKYSEENKKLPPFRAGKYIPKDNVYSCSSCLQNEKTTASSSKPKESSNKMVSCLGSPPPFRTGKYTPNDSGIYVKSSDKFPSQSASPTQGSPKHKGRKQSVERIISTLDEMCLNGRRSPSSPKRRSHGVSSTDGSKASSLEQIGCCSSARKSSMLPGLRNQMSHSADAVNKNLKTRPKSAAMENYAKSRSRTKSENMLTITTTPRPKSSVLENSATNFRTIVKDIDIGSPEKFKVRKTVQNRPRSAVLENGLSSRLPMKIVTNPKNQLSVGKTLDRTPSRESNRFLRKGSDSSERGHQRSKTTTSISSSCSERSYKAMKTKKPRQELQRNAAYVKPRINRNYKHGDRKKASSRKKAPLGPRQEKISTDKVDSCIPEKPSAAEKPVVFSLFMDKFCVRTQDWNGQFRIPALKRYRVMAWKIKRISYLLYEKVSIVFYSIFLALLMPGLIYSKYWAITGRITSFWHPVIL